MTYTPWGITHGGIALYSQVVKAAVAAGWALDTTSYGRADWGTQPVVQNNTIPIQTDITGVPLPFVLPLPIMFFDNYVVKKDFVTSVTLGVDYSIDPDFGTVTILSGGVWDNGSGFGTGEFTILQGYDIKRGWVILRSFGISTTEDFRIGFRFNSAATNPSNPQQTGVEISCWTTPPTAFESYELVDLTRRNALVHDVKCMISPNADVTGAYSLDADRIIFHGRADCFTAWGCAGIPARFRPLAEQPLLTGMMGSTSLQQDRAGGPVGKTDEPGDLSLSTEMGSIYLFEQGAFCAVDDNVELNANYWENEVGHPTNGYTTSQRVITPGSGATLPVPYFEVHDVITGRAIDVVGSSSNILYGLWNGLHTVLCAEPSHNLQVTMDGRAFRLWKVGGSLSRFIAVEEI